MVQVVVRDTGTVSVTILMSAVKAGRANYSLVYLFHLQGRYKLRVSSGKNGVTSLLERLRFALRTLEAVVLEAGKSGVF